MNHVTRVCVSFERLELVKGLTCTLGDSPRHYCGSVCLSKQMWVSGLPATVEPQHRHGGPV